jgi:hypothetical protein
MGPKIRKGHASNNFGVVTGEAALGIDVPLGLQQREGNRMMSNI